MIPKFKHHWRRTPVHIRKPVVLFVGLLFVIAAGLTGWLPGPGGIPLFLIGIAILATEFTWAQRVKEFILNIVHMIGQWYRTHRIIGTIIIILLACVSATLAYLTFMQLHK